MNGIDRLVRAARALERLLPGPLACYTQALQTVARKRILGIKFECLANIGDGAALIPFVGVSCAPIIVRYHKQLLRRLSMVAGEGRRYQVRSLLCDHDGGGVDVRRGNRRHHRSVSHAQAFSSPNA